MYWLFFLYPIIVIFMLLVLLKIYIKWNSAMCNSSTCLTGKTVLITGANTGIGYETALDLAKRGAKVILACRDRKKAQEARDKIIQETGNYLISSAYIDFSNLQTVREFAQDINKTEPKLDILINNAGAAGMKNKLTNDGLELGMQINYFGPFTLTILLLDLLNKSGPSRVINVSSIAARLAGNFSVESLKKLQGYEASYYNSKLCNILFTQELAKRVNPNKVTFYSVHPGAVKTDIFRRIKGWKKFFYSLLIDFCFKSPLEGAQTIIQAAVQKDLETFNGRHLVECRVVEPYKTARNNVLQKVVFEKTLEILGLDFDNSNY